MLIHKNLHLHKSQQFTVMKYKFKAKGIPEIRGSTHASLRSPLCFSRLNHERNPEVQTIDL